MPWNTDTYTDVVRAGIGLASMGASELGVAGYDAASGKEVDWLDVGKRVAGGMGGWIEAAALQAAQWQRDAASEAAQRAEDAGNQGADYNRQAGDRALELNLQGQQAAADEYRRALAGYQGQQQLLAGLYAPQRQAGAMALDQMNAAVLGGDMSRLQLDPSYQFQAAEAQKALERRANASGMYGSGGNIKDTIRMQQQMASRAYGDAIDRLMGIAVQGQMANNNLQAMNAQATNNIMGAYGALAQNATEGNRFAANTILNTAIQSANARNQTANTVNGYNLQAVNAQTQGIGAVNNGIQTGLNTAAYATARRG